MQSILSQGFQTCTENRDFGLSVSQAMFARTDEVIE
jgi:hypothetical protein